MDDLRARKVAQYNGVQIIGSIGILLMAKNQGLIPLIKPYLDMMQQFELHLSSALVADALKMAGET